MYGLGIPELILTLAAILLLIFSNKLPAFIRDMERQGRMISDVGLRLSDFDLQHINVFANDILIRHPAEKEIRNRTS